jgi:hypothetical protein
MMTKGLIDRLFGEEEISAKEAPEPLSQMRDPTLDERVSLYLRAVDGTRDFGPTDSSNARNDILDAMAADVAVKLGIAPQRNRGLSPPRDLPDISGLQAEGPPYLMEASFQASIENPAPDVDFVMAAQARPYFADLAAPAGPTIRPADMAAPVDIRRMHFADKEDFSFAAPEISRPPVKFSLRTIGTLSIMVCTAALIAGAGTFLFSKNEDSSLAWFAQPQESFKTEVASQSSGSKAALMPATVKPPTVTSESPNQQPSPEELAELAKRGRALLTAETVSRGPSVEVQAVASRSPIQQLSPEELAELVKRGDGLIGAGTASLLPSLAASQAVTSGSLTLASALAWYQNSKDFGSTESIGSAREKGNPN